MNFRDISASAVTLVCVLFIFNALVVHKTVGRHLDASYKLFKYRNLLQTAKEINDIADETIEEFKAKSLFGYHVKRPMLVCNVIYKNLKLTEREKLIVNEKKIRVFLKPLTKVTADIKKQPNATHFLNDLMLLRYKVIDLILTVKYVERHLHNDIPQSSNTKTRQASGPPYQTPSNISLGNKIVSLLQCFRQELFYSARFYQDKVKELKNAKYV
ncbi:Hypothetical predicted protein [Paramuricea clavata]|uniref:Uncharacterized protein n=1 Tax=Paramuricea clavata TaxID=317549 RepID=A0A7D9IL95_PARCT|nr:Hypothetical predicted protein [Paramuricea clavata]